MLRTKCQKVTLVVGGNGGGGLRFRSSSSSSSNRLVVARQRLVLLQQQQQQFASVSTSSCTIRKRRIRNEIQQATITNTSFYSDNRGFEYRNGGGYHHQQHSWSRNTKHDTRSCVRFRGVAALNHNNNNSSSSFMFSSMKVIETTSVVHPTISSSDSTTIPPTILITTTTTTTTDSSDPLFSNTVVVDDEPNADTRRPFNVTGSSSSSGKEESIPKLPLEKQLPQPPPQSAIFLPTLYRYLQLELFNHEEIDTVFDRIYQSIPYFDMIDEKHDSSNSNSNNIPPISITTNMSNETTTTTTTAMNEFISIQHIEEFLFQRIIFELDMPQFQNNMTVTPIINVNDDTNNKNTNYRGDNQMNQIRVLQHEYAHSEAKRVMSLLLANDLNVNEYKDQIRSNTFHSIQITKKQFRDQMIQIGSSIDMKSTIPIAASMLFVGSSVGIITPAMPFVVEQLQLSTSEYGIVVSAFALAKLLGNIPASIAVEQYGRKPFMVYSLAPLMAIAVAGIGMSQSFTELITCRLLTGAGVAALSTAGTLMVTDSSTSLNRASTLAPVMSAFAAGTALGPAIGGMLVDTIGLQATFYSVGISFFSAGILNNFLLQETKQSKQMEFPWHKIVLTNNNKNQNNTTNDINNDGQVGTTGLLVPPVVVATKPKFSTTLNEAVGQWIPLLRTPAIRNVMIMNGMYWIALAGSQMTLLPLLLTANDCSFHMTATQVGQVYMGMSLIQFIGNPIFAKVSDKIGQSPAIIGGCTLIGCSMMILPITDTVPQLATTLALWAAGSSMLSTAPVAFLSDAVMMLQRQKQQDEQKEQQQQHQQEMNQKTTIGDNVVNSNIRSPSPSSTGSSTIARAQAIALLRTCGDVGFLLGAAGIGLLADTVQSVETAMQCSSVMLLASTAWYTSTRLSCTLFPRTTTTTTNTGTDTSTTTTGKKSP